MDFENTDFDNESFDVVFAQAATSTTNRNKIIKEVKRVLKPSGIFCVGEIVSLSEKPPAFVKDLWEASEIFPLPINGVTKYYEERKFEVLSEKDLSLSLKDFYRTSINLLKDKINKISEQEKIYHKKFLKKVSHESNAYLNLGGDKHMGFSAVILKKVQN